LGTFLLVTVKTLEFYITQEGVSPDLCILGTFLREIVMKKGLKVKTFRLFVYEEAYNYGNITIK